MTAFCLFPEALEGVGSSGKLVGIISKCLHTSPAPWYRVMAKNPGGFLPTTLRDFFTLRGIVSQMIMLRFYRPRCLYKLMKAYINFIRPTAYSL